MGIELPRLKLVHVLASSTLAISLAAMPEGAQAATIGTNFDNIAIGTSNFTIGTPEHLATFSGSGVQVDTLGIPALYASPPQALVLTGAGFGGSGTLAQIDFNSAFNTVSFTAVNGGNGQAQIQVFDSNTNLLQSVAVTANTASAPEALFTFAFDDIGSITVLNPGPASPPNPPYITAIDNFSAAKIPEPTTVLGSLLALGFGIWFKRRRKLQAFHQ